VWKGSPKLLLGENYLKDTRKGKEICKEEPKETAAPGKRRTAGNTPICFKKEKVLEKKTKAVEAQERDLAR